MFRRTLASALIVGAALIATVTLAVPAQAEDNCDWFCGTVSNFTSNHMLVAALGSDTGGHGDPGTCTFVWDSVGCRTKTLPVGTTSGPDNTFKDVDGFTFTGTHFYYNGVYFPANLYVRLHNPEYIVCIKPGSFWAPRCANA